MADVSHSPPEPPSLSELFLAFFAVSLSGFGGTLPWAYRMVVEKRRWMTAAEFSEVFSLCQFLPGANVVNFSVVFGMVVLPLTYVPILLVARNRKIMGKHVNSKVTDFFAWIFLVFIVVSALAAIPLMVITNSGQP